jgi:hypothetical protein
MRGVIVVALGTVARWSRPLRPRQDGSTSRHRRGARRRGWAPVAKAVRARSRWGAGSSAISRPPKLLPAGRRGRRPAADRVPLGERRPPHEGAPDDAVTVDLKSRTIGHYEANDLGHSTPARAFELRAPARAGSRRPIATPRSLPRALWPTPARPHLRSFGTRSAHGFRFPENVASPKGFELRRAATRRTATRARTLSHATSPSLYRRCTGPRRRPSRCRRSRTRDETLSTRRTWWARPAQKYRAYPPVDRATSRGVDATKQTTASDIGLVRASFGTASWQAAEDAVDLVRERPQLQPMLGRREERDDRR